MRYITLPLATTLFSIASIVPAAAQSPRSNMRVDTTRTIIRDAYGNIVGQSLEVRMEGSFESRKDYLKSQKVAFFTNNIDFTPKEAEKFWPVYNEYSDKRDNLMADRRQILRQLSEFERMENEKDIKTLLDAYITSFTKEADLLQEYYKKFALILSPKKVARLYQTEEHFKRLLIETIRGR